MEESFACHLLPQARFETDASLIPRTAGVGLRRHYWRNSSTPKGRRRLADARFTRAGPATPDVPRFTDLLLAEGGNQNCLIFEHSGAKLSVNQTDDWRCPLRP